MNSVTSGIKKTALCRYYVSNGSCFYGSECQFLHSAPSNSNPSLVDIRDDGPAEDSLDSIVTHNDRLDSLFLAFSQQNGLPQESKLAAYLNNRPINSVVNNLITEKSSYSSSNSIGNQLNSTFAALSLDSVNTKNTPNPGANEFIPRSTTPATSLPITSTSPSFLNYNISTTTAASTPFRRLSQGGSNYTGKISPLQSPRLTPTHSPLLKRRTRSPNLSSLNTSVTPSVDAFASAVPTYQENVGGTTYYYTHEEEFPAEPQGGVVLPNFHMYPGTPGHIAHMNPKANAPSFFMPDELRMDVLHRHSLMMAHVDPEQYPDLPTDVDSYHNLVPLEPLPTSSLEKSSTFGYVTSVYKATNVKTGIVYCLRKVHGFRISSTKCMALVDMWKKLQHSNIVQAREVFTTKAFGEHSTVFVHDYHPGAETMMARHFSSSATASTNTQRNNSDSLTRSLSQSKAGPRQNAGLLPESLIWCYIVQLSSALRTIHAAGLAYRTLEPTKILLTGKSRLRLNCCGIFDVLGYDPNQSNPLAMMAHYQQEDLVALGKIVLTLACNSITGIQRDRIQSSMELIARSYSADLRNLILYLLTSQNRIRSVNDIMPMIGARFYTQLDAAQMRSDVIENELAKEVENGRLLRLLVKLGIINERPELSLDPTWSETGDRYMLKLFRDYVFHQVTEHGHPWIDLSHIIQCLNKLDAGVNEKICLMSRDEQNVLVVSYAELKHCFETSFNEIAQATQQGKPTS